jgi:hypothetical protein
MATEVAQDLPTRLRKARTVAADAKRAYELALEQRDALIVEAVDDHAMTQTAVAELAGVAKGRITPILAKAGRDADD